MGWAWLYPECLICEHHTYLGNEAGFIDQEAVLSTDSHLYRQDTYNVASYSSFILSLTKMQFLQKNF